jgi:hypothetical protein
MPKPVRVHPGKVQEVRTSLGTVRIHAGAPPVPGGLALTDRVEVIPSPDDPAKLGQVVVHGLLDQRGFVSLVPVEVPLDGVSAHEQPIEAGSDTDRHFPSRILIDDDLVRRVARKVRW